MAFLTAALLGLGAYGSGKQQQRDYSLANEQTQASIESERANTALAQQQQRDYRTLNQLDPVTGEYKGYTPPPTLTQVIPHNAGVAPDPNTYRQAHIDLLNQQAMDAERRGYPQTAANLRAQARDEALNTNTLASAAYTSGAKTKETLSMADYNEARSKAAATAQATAIQIAGMRNSTALQVARQNMLGRQELAQYNGQERYAIATLAGAISLRNHDQDAAVREGIAQYNGMLRNYLQATSAKNALLDPSAAAAAQAGGLPGLNIPGAPTINYYMGPSGGMPGYGVPPLVPQFQPGGAAPAGGAQPVRPPAAVNQNVYNTVMQNAQSMFREGKKVDEIRRQLDILHQEHKVDDATYAALKAQFGGVQGGSQGATPF